MRTAVKITHDTTTPALDNVPLQQYRLTDEALLFFAYEKQSIGIARGSSQQLRSLWAPAYADPECTELADSELSFAWVTSDSHGQHRVSLNSWHGDRIMQFARPAALL